MIGLLNSTGDLVARYVYDAWGQPISITDGKGKDVSGDPSHIANRNPLRYRGYYYDQETGFYYLQSRYYDPVLCRFINADSFASTGQGFLGYNMYVYCNNNPTTTTDSVGSYPTYATMVLDGGYGGGNYIPDQSDYGSAPDYVSIKSDGNYDISPNCYAYAIGYYDKSYSPGDFSVPYGEYTLESVTKAVLSDMKELGRSARIIKSFNSPISSSEYRIALRVKTMSDPRDWQDRSWDYHFMVQTSTGRWAEKSGPSSATYLYVEGTTPENAPWSNFGITGYYDSPIVYFAISW